MAEHQDLSTLLGEENDVKRRMQLAELVSGGCSDCLQG